MNEPDSLGPLVEDFIRHVLSRGDDTPVDKACEDWLPAHVMGKGPVFPLAFQTYAICELVEMYELVARAGVAAAGALIFEKNPELGREACAELAKGMIHEAGNHIRLADCDAGPAH